MNKNEVSLEKLNSELNHFVLEMKPYVLKHPNNTERQHCALWIKKLCDPATRGSSLAGHKNRNLHARLLLHMLKRGVLEGPFASKPQHGSLKNLPTYMSIYFDEPLIGGSEDHSKVTLPDWVMGELDDEDSLAAVLLKDGTTSTPNTALTRARHLNKEKTPRGARASSSLKPSPTHEARAVDAEQMSPDDGDLEARLNSWNLGIEKPGYLRRKTSSTIFKSGLIRSHTLPDDVDLQLQSQEVDMRVKVLECKHQEEKVKMQQRHDADVDKILHQRNVEIDELKSRYRAQQKESEEMIHKLEWKVQSVLKESQVICESKDKQIAELKKMTDQSVDCLKNEWEKKLLAAVADVEKEKFELQKQHTDNIQELLESTKMRLAKMEAEYNTRSQSTVQMVRELERQVKEQCAQVEKSKASLQKAMQEKAELEIHLAAASAELQEANRRLAVLQTEKDEQRILFEETLQKFQAKHEADLNHLHQEHALSVAKASEVMEDFEKTIAQLKQQLLVSEHQRQTQVRDQVLKFQKEKEELQILLDKKVLALQNEAEKERTQAKKQMTKLEDALRDTENQLDRSRESHRVHLQEADMALEQLRRQVKLSSEKAEAQLKLQMEKVQEDLQHSRCLRENQSKEFSQQLDALRQKYEQQMAEQRVQHEQERTRLHQQHCAEKDSLVQQRQREVSSLESQAKAALQTHQQRTQEWRKRDGQTISELEGQLSRLREKFQVARGQHEQQLAEMAALREEERQKANLDKETLRSDMERALRDLQRSHQQEKEMAEDKTNSRFKHIEKEYSQTLARSAQIIVELQHSVCSSKEEAVGLQQTMKRQQEEANNRWTQEKTNMTQRANQANEALREKVESLQRQLRSSEKALLSKELESEEKVTTLRQEYEEKMKGLLPAELRQELEDTITSFKAQVKFLQRRADFLQEGLDACRNKRSPQAWDSRSRDTETTNQIMPLESADNKTPPLSFSSRTHILYFRTSSFFPVKTISNHKSRTRPGPITLHG
ncbi:centrosomal protein of 112 kDa isoform X1 [Hippocampus zosterae]|uniref:centrosomal protein of 112 kDa isoform X1 n=1 Tax=Hippocampus zosterae TaxID=109293 RepID=UPI00223D86A7|nr:centrosomal protein of 112 kDa isoform X1 [Hippocampus zosterae]XP_051905476.1 centrosomal protein of 112 kDa isoform X1 [Hippocampus zosterae]